jgi:hypothetical protein
MEHENLNTEETANSDLGAVSGSFSDNDIKWVLYYGHTKDKRIFLDEEKSGLDYYLEDAFRGNKTKEIFGEIFWNRIRKLVENYR